MNSKEAFENIRDLVKANYPLVYAITTEYNRTMQYIRNISHKLNFKFYSWDCVAGLSEHERNENGGYTMNSVAGNDDYNGFLDNLMQSIEPQGNPNEKAIYLVEDLHRYFDQPETFTRLRKLAERLKFYDKHVILSGPFIKIPDELEKFVTVVNIPLPDRSDLKKLLTRVAGEMAINDDLEKYFIDSALGMTDMEADLAFRLAKEKVGLNSIDASEIISKEKQQIIKKSGILDYYEVPKEDSLNSKIGGLENLKKWLVERKVAFQRKAKEFGLQDPKGILLVGVPGCGKSLTAKCVAAEWKQPLLKLDIGKVFQAEVGASENNIRQAIATAEAVAPCVLWIDEIEKGLSTGGGEKDGGTNSRVFSTILTWMQEKTKPVFVVATANNIQSLPPELLRKGRFDEIFFVDLPTHEERKNIFKIHLAKYKQNSITDFDSLADKSKYFNGAEIEECVKEAMFIAYNENSNVTQISIKHLETAIEPIVPLAMTMPNQINFLREFGKSKRARPASKEFNEESLQAETESKDNKVVKTKSEKEFDIYSE
jgi:ATP-dependent 26S proteasome regulatory subunit